MNPILKNSLKLLTVPAIAAVTLFAAQSAQAAGPYFWDGNDSSADFGSAGGTWAAPTAGTTTAGWSTSATGASVVNGNSITTTTADALNFGNGATGLAAGTITVSGTVNAGNMTFASGSGGVTLSGGTSITVPAAAVITVNNAADTISTPLLGAATSLQISGASGSTLSIGGSAALPSIGTLIIDSGVTFNYGSSASTTEATTVLSGAGTLAMSGSGALTFSSNTLLSSFTGAIALNSGTVNLNATNVPPFFNGNPLIFNGNATLTVNTAFTSSAGITLNNGAIASFGCNTKTFTFNSAVTGNGGITLIQQGQGNWTLNLNSTANNFTGPIAMNGSKTNNTLTVNSLADSTTGNITFGGTSPATTAFVYGAGAVVPLTLTNRQFVMGGSATNYTISNSSSQAFTINTDLSYTGSGAKVLTLGGNGTGLNTFAGKIIQGTGANTLAITKSGTGSWNLTGANTYAGQTRTTAGTLIVNNLANGGSACSIGQSTSAAGLVLGGGTFQYAPIAAVGGAAAAIDRNFAILSSSSLDASGTDALVFSAPSGNIISPDVTGLTGTWTSGQKVITGISSTANLVVGMRITGTGIAASSTIASIDSATQVTLNNNTTALGSTSAVTFGYPTARTLTLTGNNTNANTLVGNLQDSAATGAGVLSLTKNGGGTWTLSGVNTYSGATTVSNGTLLVSNPGSLAAGSAVAVNGGTLGGNGTINGNVTVAAAGSLSPGGSSADTLTIGGNLNISAPANGGAGKLVFQLDALANPNDKIAVTGTLTLGSGVLGFSDFVFSNLGGLQVGTYKLITSGGISGTLDSSDLSGTIGALPCTLQIVGTDLELVASPPDTTPPTLASIVNNKGGGPVAPNTSVTYTVTFSEAMAAGTVVATDFGNAGTASVTIGTITQISPGVFTVSVTPTSSGTLQLMIHASAVLTDLAGNHLDTTTALLDGTTIAVPRQVTRTFSLGTSPALTTLENDVAGLLPWIAKGTLPVGSILRSVSINAKIENVGTDPTTDDWASQLSVYIDPTPQSPGTAARLQVGGYNAIGTVALALDYGNLSGWANGDSGPPATVIDTKTEAAWASLGAVDLSSAQVSVGNDYSEAAWSGTLTIVYDDNSPPALVSIVDDKAGGPLTPNTLVTYTLTFNKDMDANTLIAADFGNAGTAPVTIGAVTANAHTPGIFTVQATPTNTGTLILKVNAGANLKDIAGDAMVTTSAIADDTTLAVHREVTRTYQLGSSPACTTIESGVAGLLPWIAKGTLPVGSILRAVSANAKIENVGTDPTTDDWASQLCVYIDPTPQSPSTAARLQVGGYNAIGTVALALDYGNLSGWANGDSGPPATVIDTKTQAAWASLAPIDLSTVQVSVGNDYSEAAWSGTLTIVYDDDSPPAVVGIVDDKAGGPVEPGTLVTYTVTFNKDMDASTLSAADFGNAGTAAVSIGAVTPNAHTPGVFTVQTTPTGPGTLILQINAGADLKDIIGNTMITTSTIADDTTIAVNAVGYASWATTNAPSGTAADDYDGDGVSNGAEYVLGGTKDTNDFGKLPKTSTTGGNLLFNFVRDQKSINATTTVGVEVGTNLVTWPDTYTVGTDTASSSPGVTIVKDSPTIGFDTVTLTLPQSPETAKFARLKVVIAP